MFFASILLAPEVLTVVDKVSGVIGIYLISLAGFVFVVMGLMTIVQQGSKGILLFVAIFIALGIPYVGFRYEEFVANWKAGMLMLIFCSVGVMGGIDCFLIWRDKMKTPAAVLRNS